MADTGKNLLLPDQFKLANPVLITSQL